MTRPICCPANDTIFALFGAAVQCLDALHLDGELLELRTRLAAETDVNKWEAIILDYVQVQPELVMDCDTKQSHVTE